MKRTRAELEAELAYQQGQATIYQVALSAIVDAPAAVERFSIDGGRYTLRLYRPTAAHGGLVTTTYACKGQATVVLADYLDSLANVYWAGHAGATALPFCRAVERLTRVRNKANEAPRRTEGAA